MTGDLGHISSEEWEVRRDLAIAYRMFHRWGWDDLIYTHLSARVPGPDHHFLLNPFDLGFDEITPQNLVKVDMEGNAVCWSSSGSHGFKGSKKGTSFAAQVAAGATARTARDNGVRTLDVRLRGPGAGREAAVRALSSAGIQIRSLRDVTPVPHNGCRPPKRRRV